METKWMEPYLEAYLDRLMLSIRKLCNVFEIAHLADEVTGEVLLLICQKANEYDPGRASFVTWVIEQAKGVVHQMIAPSRHMRYGGTKSNGISMRYEHMFAEWELPELFDETYPTLAVDQKFSDPFDVPGLRARQFIDSLTASERACLRLLLQEGRVKYRPLGKLLGVSHTQAGKLLPEIMSSLREKAERLR